MTERSEGIMNHAGHALSALLDGELTAVEADEVRAHVAGCHACTRELDDVRVARRLVRQMPAVEPPAGWLEEMLSDGRVARFAPRRRGAMASVAVSVAAGLLLVVLSANIISPAKRHPEVASTLERHASTVSALDDIFKSGATRLVPTDPVPPTTAAQRSMTDLPAPYDAPETLAGYRLIEAFRTPGGGVHLLYRKGQYGLSVFETPGGVDWSELPDGGTRIELSGHQAWRWNAKPASGRLLVIEEHDITVTIVGDEPGDAVLSVAAEMPHWRSLPIEQRVKRAVANALELLSPAP